MSQEKQKCQLVLLVFSLPHLHAIPGGPHDSNSGGFLWFLQKESSLESLLGAPDTCLLPPSWVDEEADGLHEARCVCVSTFS